jgi:cellulose synthase operon protein YhjQ
MSIPIAAVVSMKGGVGKTTVAANLGAVLSQDRAHNVLLVDFDPRNQLGLHFGMSVTDVIGLAHALEHDGPVAQALHYRLDRLPFLPFGMLDEDQRDRFEDRLRERPTLLHDALDTPEFRDFHFALVDAAPGPSLYLRHVLSIANLVLVVLQPDAASFATLPSIQAALDRWCRPRADFAGAFFVVNGMETSRRLARDLRAAYAGQLGDALVPFVVHTDQAVREALAFQRPVVDQSPTCQATADFRQLASFVSAQMASVRRGDAADETESSASRDTIRPPV